MFLALSNSLTLALGDNGMETRLCEKLTATMPSGKLWVGCELIHAGTDLIGFYKERNYTPVWVNSQGLNKLGKSLPLYLRSAKEQGLNPEDYHYGCIEATINHIDSFTRQKLPIAPQQLADLDILLTDAFMIYASHLVAGKVDPERIYPLWLSQEHKTDIIAGLKELTMSQDLEQTVKSFAPPHPEYWQLLRAAKRLQQIVAAGGWPTVPDGETLRPGDTDPRIPILRKRLAITGDLSSASMTKSQAYDQQLQKAVKKFQARHGLAIDGVAGPNTFKALNVSAKARHEQLLLNLERWRWVPRRWTDRYLIVNTAAFNLEAHEGGRKVLSSRVIVGKEYQKTPVFSGRMSYLEVNPYWNVPHSIAVKELLPEIKKNPGYLTKNHYELLASVNGSTQALNPWAIPWDRINSQNFPWRIRQLPGKWNALGHIKFMFPNHFHVYLHDTPNRNLFNRPQRDLSHGCIRVEKPLELAALVLQDDPSWTRKRVEDLIAMKKRRVVNIPNYWMVHLLYWTAWVDDDGEVQYRADIYDRDPILWQALAQTDSNPYPGALKLSERNQSN